MADVANRRSGMRRKLVIALQLAVTVYLLLAAGLFWAMRQPVDRFGRIMSKTPFPLLMVLPFETLWNVARGGTVHPGDPAPDFRLPMLDHSGYVQLSSFKGSRPVVLVFGSYT
jgi:hypothetical protein